MCTQDGVIRCPCCCFLPYLNTRDRSGQLIGTSKYMCDHCLFVPKFQVMDAQGREVYRVRPDTCVLGCCVRCKCGGVKGKCCRVPYVIRDPRTNAPIEDAEIVDMWAGFKNECCTRKNIYGIKFPSQASQQMKASLIGTALLIDITMVEQEGS